MKFFKKFKKNALPEQSEIAPIIHVKNHFNVGQETGGSALSKLLKREMGLSYSDCFTFYRECEPVASVIDIIAENFSHLPIYLEIKGKIAREHPILTLLANPNPDFTGQLFLTTLAHYYLITGETYVVAQGNINREPRTIYPLNPLNVSINQDPHGLIGSFDVTGESWPGTFKREDKNYRTIFNNSNFRELRQIRRFSTYNNSQYRGESKLLAAASDVRQSIAGNLHNTKTLTKGGFLSLIFQIKDDMNFLKFQEAQEQIRSQYSGPQSESVAVVNSNQLDVKELGMNNRDMDFHNLQMMAQKAIAKRFGVPLQLVSDSSSTYNNLNTAYQALYDNCVLPLANDLLSGLGALLLPRYNLDPANAKLCVDTEKVPSLALRRAELAEKKRASYACTDNEVRRVLGLPDNADGNVIWRPANWVSDEQYEEQVTVARNDDQKY